MKVKENEYKEKRRYDWCVFKEKNTGKQGNRNRRRTPSIQSREESRIQEKYFGNFQVEEKMNVIKEIRERFKRFFYQEETFNFSPFKRN